MGPDKYQKELFEFETPKKPAARFGNIFQRADFAIVLTAEKMVFTAIGLIMLMVIFFALGVEKGKSAVYSRPAAAKAAIATSVAAPEAPVKTAAVTITASRPIVPTTNITPKSAVSAITARTQAAYDKTKPYTVVAAAFSRADFAAQEAAKLKMNGLEAYVYYGEPYYLACVGSFQNKEGAQKILSRVKQMHKDAYVRVR